MYRAVLPLLAALALCSCADVEAVAQFAHASHDAGISFRRIAAAGLPSCERAATFVVAGQDKPNCAAFERIEQPVVAINNALFAYFDALGHLAGADRSKLTAGIDNISTRLASADPNISSESLAQAGAVGGLVSALAKLATSGYREHEVRIIMVEANPAVQQAAGFLAVYAAGKYEQGLNDERTRERTFCLDEIRRNGSAEPIASLLLRRQCDSDRVITERRLAGIGSYRESVESAARAHQMLAAYRRKWDSAFLRSVLPELQQLADAADAAHSAF